MQLKVCQNKVARYFLQEVIHPDSEWDDDLMIQTLENVATFMIKGNQGPIIFRENEFSENIGTTGGAIHIENPDFRYADKERNPYIVIMENKFFNNMAYWAGNVFHISMTIRMF